MINVKRGNFCVKMCAVLGEKMRNELLFQALADLTRIRLIRLLVSTKQEVCLCEFVDSLLEPEYKISRHLKVLKQAGLITAKKEGRWVYHGLVANLLYLKNLYTTIKSLPDDDGTFKKDFGNFQKRMKFRTSGRCQTGIINPKLKEWSK